MEQIYNYIVHNKIGSIILPFKYCISGDTVYIDWFDYYSYWVKLRSTFQADSIIHDVTGCSKLYIKADNNFHCFVWNGYSYTNHILKTR